LCQLAPDHVQRRREWPKNPSMLSNHLRRIAPALREFNVEFERGRRAGGNRTRTIVLRSTTAGPVPAVPTVPDTSSAAPPKGSHGDEGDGRDGAEAAGRDGRIPRLSDAEVEERFAEEFPAASMDARVTLAQKRQLVEWVLEATGERD